MEIVFLGNPRQTLPICDPTAGLALTKVSPGQRTAGIAVAPPADGKAQTPIEAVPQARRQGSKSGNNSQGAMSAKAQPPKTARRQMLTSKALSCRGLPYRWGGSRLETGVDCSGFTRYLYLNLGIQLPHSARLQFSVGRPVSALDLLPGDLVFFNTRGPLTHVGMYVGDGKFVHASNPKRGIKIDRLASRYYGSRFAGARRYTS